jgi:hypothetical protein
MRTRICTTCGKVGKPCNFETYWVDLKIRKKGYRCARCIAHKEGRGRAFDIAHDSKYKNIMFCPIGTKVRPPVKGHWFTENSDNTRKIEQLLTENHLLSLELFDAKVRLGEINIENHESPMLKRLSQNS